MNSNNNHKGKSPRRAPRRPGAKQRSEVLVVKTKGFGYVVALMAFIVIAALVFLVTATYTKRATVNGVITSSKGVVKITTKARGHIEKQHFAIGDTVKKGDVLFTISTKRQSAERPDLDGEILAQLQQSKRLLESEISNNLKLAQVKIEHLKLELAKKRQERQMVSEQGRLLDEQARLADEQLKRNKALYEQGHIVEQTYNQSYSQVLDIEFRQKAKAINLSSIENNILTLENEIIEHPIAVQIKQDSLKKSQSDINRQIVEATARRDYSILSPVDGTIATVLSHQGETVNANHPILTILPGDSTFQAELYITPSAIGFVKPEQKVSMRYSAFPYQHFGLQHGVVKDVSQVISMPQELAKVINLNKAAYKVTVELDSQTVKAAGKDMALNAGMELEATISLENRTLIQWLFEPIYSLRGRI